MDRVVIDKNDNIYILDYKTGKLTKQEIANYKSQVLNYMNILKDVFGQCNLLGFLYNVNTKEVIKIEQSLFD